MLPCAGERQGQSGSQLATGLLPVIYVQWQVGVGQPGRARTCLPSLITTQVADSSLLSLLFMPSGGLKAMLAPPGLATQLIVLVAGGGYH